MKVLNWNSVASKEESSAFLFIQMSNSELPWARHHMISTSCLPAHWKRVVSNYSKNKNTPGSSLLKKLDYWCWAVLNIRRTRTGSHWIISLLWQQPHEADLVQKQVIWTTGEVCRKHVNNMQQEKSYKGEKASESRITLEPETMSDIVCVFIVSWQSSGSCSIQAKFLSTVKSTFREAKLN